MSSLHHYSYKTAPPTTQQPPQPSSAQTSSSVQPPPLVSAVLAPIIGSTASSAPTSANIIQQTTNLLTHHYHHQQQQQPISGQSSSANIVPQHHSSSMHFGQSINLQQQLPPPTQPTQPQQQQQSKTVPIGTNQLFIPNNNISNPHMPIEVMLNSHNHPDKNGRTLFINSGKMLKMPLSNLKVYLNNNNPDQHSEAIDLEIALDKVFDNGAFGHVRGARLKTNEFVAVKQVLQDKRYRNRELPLMKQLKHRNIVTLLYYFYHDEDRKLIYLNLVMEYIPFNLNTLIQRNNKIRKTRHILPGDLSTLIMPLITIKLCMYQIFRALAYIHSKGICHRDIKPNNLLFNSENGVLKICDFGSAKHLKRGESHVSYICARYYRAPELLFGATDYTEKIDLWSTGVVFSELLLGRPIFHEESGMDQLVLIISKLGTPTKEQIMAMNPRFVNYEFPQVWSVAWPLMFPNTPSDALDLIAQLFQYNPAHRISPLRACAHQFFDELREPNKKWLCHELPPLFDFTDEELSIDPAINIRLMPFSPTNTGFTNNNNNNVNMNNNSGSKNNANKLFNVIGRNIE